MLSDVIIGVVDNAELGGRNGNKPSKLGDIRNNLKLSLTDINSLVMT